MWRWMIAVVLGLAMIAVPVLRYRMVYETEKRFREVSPGKFYRSGQMSEDAFREKIRDHKIKLVINLQDENPDPLLPSGYFDQPHILESKVCEEEGARYVMLSFAGDRGLLDRKDATPANRPVVIDDFLKLCDKHRGEPILIHCMAGLHRTGALTAVYRMEYEGWSVADAVRELRANGYGDRKATTANDYIYEYIFQYQPRPGARGQGTEDRK